MSEQSVTTPLIELLHIELEIPIKATPTRVFRALTQEIDAWWDKEHATLKQGKIVLELELGKRFYEDWGNGEGTVMGTVIRIAKPTLLEIEGHIGMDKPVEALLRFELVPQQGETILLKVTYRATGIINPHALQAFTQAWKLLFEVCLPAYLQQEEQHQESG